MPFEVTAEAIDRFAELTGDRNPIHLDVAAASRYGGRVAHGLLTLSMVPPYLVERFGVGTILVRVDSKFTRPVCIGDSLTIEGYSEIGAKGDRADIALTIANQRGVSVAEVKAEVIKGGAP